MCDLYIFCLLRPVLSQNLQWCLVFYTSLDIFILRNTMIQITVSLSAFNVTLHLCNAFYSQGLYFCTYSRAKSSRRYITTPQINSYVIIIIMNHINIILSVQNVVRTVAESCVVIYNYFQKNKTNDAISSNSLPVADTNKWRHLFKVGGATKPRGLFSKIYCLIWGGWFSYKWI